MPIFHHPFNWVISVEIESDLVTSKWHALLPLFAQFKFKEYGEEKKPYRIRIQIDVMATVVCNCWSSAAKDRIALKLILDCILMSWAIKLSAIKTKCLRLNGQMWKTHHWKTKNRKRISVAVTIKRLLVFVALRQCLGKINGESKWNFYSNEIVSIYVSAPILNCKTCLLPTFADSFCLFHAEQKEEKKKRSV